MAKESQIVIDELAKQGFWHTNINLFLTQLLKNESIHVYDETNNVTKTLDPEQGWQFVSEWAKNNNFSISKRGSRRSQIENLLGDIGNRQKLEAEAASALNSLKAKAREGQIPQAAASAISSSLQKAESIQRKQIQELQSRLFDPMMSFYYKSPLLKDIGNADLRMRAATILAAHPQIAAYYDTRQQTAGRVHLGAATNQIHMILSQALPELAPLYYSMRSDEMEAKTEKTLSDAKTELHKIYPGHSQDQIDISSLDADMSRFYQISRTGSTLTDISNIVKALPASYLTQDMVGIDQAIRQIVVRAASGTHVSGSDLLAELIREKKLSPQAALALDFLAPRLELAELDIRSELTGYGLLDRTNTRERWSANLAASLGINPSTSWLKDKDLQDATDHFLGLPEYKGTSSIKDAMEMEMSKDQPDLIKYNQLAKLHDQTSQRLLYGQARSGDTLFYLQDSLNKLGYNLQVIREPYDKASRRFWSSFDKIDDIIHYPQRKLADYWEDLVDGRKKFLGLNTIIEFKTKSGNLIRIPLLNLPHFVFMKYAELKNYLAVNVFKWSWGLAKQGGVFTPLKAIANYSFAFVQHDGDFRATNFYFGRKVMGNFLDWGAKQLKFDSFVAMKTAFGKTAFEIGNKITGGLIGKAAAYLTSLGLSVEGIGIFLTAALLTIDIVKTIGGFFKKIFNDENFRNKFLNWAPAIGVFIAGLGTFFAGIPAAIAFGFTGLISFFSAALSGIVLFFIQGFIWAGAAVLSILLIFQIVKTTSHLDAGTPQESPGIGAVGNGCVQTAPVKGEIWQGPHGDYSHSVIIALDIHLEKNGVPIKSASGGKVIYTGYNGVYGNRVDIQTQFKGKTITFIYGHLAGANVSMNQEVKAGDIIGYGDSTSSNSFFRSPHLHFEIRGVGAYSECPIPGTNPAQLEGCNNRESCNAKI